MRFTAAASGHPTGSKFDIATLTDLSRCSKPFAVRRPAVVPNASRAGRFGDAAGDGSGGVVQVVSIFGFAWLAWLGPQPAIDVAAQLRLALVIGFEALGVGLGTAAFVAFIARTTHPLYTATQFALFTSLSAVPRTFVNATTGWLVEGMGWMSFFLLCALLALPGMALLLKVAPWRASDTPLPGAGK